ncbi:MAG: lipopolysaccharide transport periplasmic protein LptA [Steroidobacterales bacterium]
MAKRRVNRIGRVNRLARTLAKVAPLAAAGMLCVPIPAANLISPEDRNAPLTYEGTHLEAEPGKMVLHDVVLKQGHMRIKADLAEGQGLNFDNSHWTLTGAVQITLPLGELRADRADVQFTDHRISTTSANGAPATFEQAAQTGREAARGHARDIDYSVDRNEVRLSGDAWLSDGHNEINSQRIVYEITSQRVQADSQAGDSDRVHGTIAPASIPRGDSAGHP